jgi:hypothetical protein
VKENSGILAILAVLARSLRERAPQLRTRPLRRSHENRSGQRDSGHPSPHSETCESSREGKISCLDGHDLYTFNPACIVTLCGGAAPRGAPVREWSARHAVPPSAEAEQRRRRTIRGWTLSTPGSGSPRSPRRAWSGPGLAPQPSRCFPRTRRRGDRSG